MAVDNGGGRGAKAPALHVVHVLVVHDQVGFVAKFVHLEEKAVYVSMLAEDRL